MGVPVVSREVYFEWPDIVNQTKIKNDWCPCGQPDSIFEWLDIVNQAKIKNVPTGGILECPNIEHGA